MKKYYFNAKKHDEAVQKCINDFADAGLEAVEVLNEIYQSIADGYLKKKKYEAKEVDKLVKLFDDIMQVRADFYSIKGE